jgi:hypothetical protein
MNEFVYSYTLYNIITREGEDTSWNPPSEQTMAQILEALRA